MAGGGIDIPPPLIFFSGSQIARIGCHLLTPLRRGSLLNLSLVDLIGIELGVTGRLIPLLLSFSFWCYLVLVGDVLLVWAAYLN